jgi:signal transduction histidine kinase
MLAATGEGGIAVPLISSAVKREFDHEALDAEMGSRNSGFGTPLRRPDFARAAVAVLGACAAVAIVLTGGVAMNPTAFAAVLAANILALAVGGLVWRHARPASLFGNLLLGEALLLVVASLAGSSVSGLYLIGILGGWAAGLGATWLLLAFPGVRLSGAAWIVMWIAVATFVLGELPLLLVSPSVSGLAAIGRCVTDCPANPALAVDAPTAAHAFRQIETALQATWGMAALLYLAVHFARASRPRRRLVAPVFAASAPFVAAFTANALLSDLIGLPLNSTARVIFAGARILFPLGFIAALLFARAYAGEALEYMARRLGGRPSVASVEQLVRRVLDDPQARLVFWLPRREHFVDRHGARVSLEPEREGVTWRAFGHGGTRMLAVVHDAALSEDPELVEAVGAATLLAFENRRLQQDLLDSVHALRASQRRLVGAASSERRKIERDLHDGVQQKLVALRIQFALALELVEGESVAGSRLAGIGDAFDDALDDLRSVAHGIYPPLLADGWLVAGLHDAARRSTVPVALDVADVGRFSEDCEAAVYYCCLEALQNVDKHAGQDAVALLHLWRDARVVHFSVSDDGVGFDERIATAGAGLTNMADRMGAIGGLLNVRSAPGEGTTVEGRLPVEAHHEGVGDVVGV